MCDSCDMETTTEQRTEAPIMVRVDITRDEYNAFKIVALSENKSPRQVLTEYVRSRIANS
jgi:hypothetical protein